MRILDRLLAMATPRQAQSLEAPTLDAAEESPAIEKEAAPASAPDALARVAGILECPAAQGREALAQHLALKTSLSVEAAVGVLRAFVVDARTASPEMPQESAKDARRRQINANFAEAFRKAEYETPYSRADEPRADDPRAVVERVRRNYDLVSGNRS